MEAIIVPYILFAVVAVAIIGVIWAFVETEHHIIKTDIQDLQGRLEPSPE